MRVSREKMEENHDAIVQASARMLRERGVDGSSIADLMQAAGMTHGGFYRHFESKDALVREATDAAFQSMGTMRNEAAGHLGNKDALTALVDYYLGAAHIDEPGSGCPIAAYGTDAARSTAAVQALFASGAEGFQRWVMDRLDGPAAVREAVASQIVCLLVGAVVAARSAGADPVAAKLVEGARAHVLDLIARHAS